MNFVYILLCKDNTFYTGWTNDLEKRFYAHQNQKGARYTRFRIPVQLVYFEHFECKREAMSREYEIKQFSRKQKEELIKGQSIENQKIICEIMEKLKEKL